MADKDSLLLSGVAHAKEPVAEMLPDPRSQPIEALGSISGVAIVQSTDASELVAQAVGAGCWEVKNRYRAYALPASVSVGRTSTDPSRWVPSLQQLRSLEQRFFVREESSCCSRMLMKCLGIAYGRPMKLHFQLDERSGDVFVGERGWSCGGCCCCPLTTRLTRFDRTSGAEVPLGRIREDFSSYFAKCCACCCKCTYYNDVELVDESGAFAKVYTIDTNTACCGPTNNCCGATCFKSDMVFRITDRRTGRIVAHLQKTYGASGGSDCLACCRTIGMFSNYLLEFPSESTPEERALLLAAVFHLDLHLFSKNDSDN